LDKKVQEEGIIITESQMVALEKSLIEAQSTAGSLTLMTFSSFLPYVTPSTQ
jgi:hypothetical protein